MKEQWIYDQFSKIDVSDARLQKRAVDIAIGCAEHPEESLAGRFDDWSDLKATYRFFSNPKITHQTLQKPHYYQVLEKARFSEETVLFIQDSSELLFNSHPSAQGLGPTADSDGNGLMFHSCLVAKYHESEETEILGLGYQEAWVRPKEKQTENNSKESEVWLRSLEQIGRPKPHWISVGDRANDIYNFLHKANDLGWKYVVRARHDRRVEIEGEQTRLFSWIRQQTAKCRSMLYVKAKGEEFAGEVTLEVTWAKTRIFPPGKTDVACEEATYIRVWCPERPKLEWLLITNLPVNDEKDALRTIKIYRRRWLIEDYHKAVKTGFRIEDNQLKHVSRILALFGLIGVLATKLLAMRELCRLFPTTPVEEKVPRCMVTLIERYLMIKLKTVRDFWRSLARMGGFIGRKSDGEPGWQTIWKGYKRLQDMLLGANLL
jgi:hypothetical protein